MKQFFQEYFYYTKQERNGAFALVILCVLCVLLPRLYPFFLSEKLVPDSEALRHAAERIELNQETSDKFEEDSGGLEAAAPPPFYFDPNTADKETFVRLGLSARTAQSILNYRSKGGRFFKSTDFKKIYTLREADYLRLAPFIRIPGNTDRPYDDRPVSESSEPAVPAELFNFDPNTADEATLGRLGISEKVIRVMLNYRSKGGRFRKKEDLAKIYSLPKADYDRLAPYIQIESSQQAVKTPPTQPAPAATVVVVDINKANAEEWQKLRGVGPAIAGRIVAYREKLGGFASTTQVGETRGLPDSTFQHILPQLQGSSIFRPLPVNAATIDDLEAHPYLSKRQAEAIAAYRANHGNFKTFEDVKKVKALTTETLDKIKPYLSY